MLKLLVRTGRPVHARQVADAQRVAGLSAAPANAVPPVLAEVDHHLPGNDRDAVAALVDHLLAGHPRPEPNDGEEHLGCGAQERTAAGDHR